MAKRRKRPIYEFKHLTQLQRRHLLRWTLHALVCLLLLIVQDVIMSRVSIRGATTDLVPMAILLITVVADVYEGSLFAIVASTFYVFSGSAPGPWAIAYITVLGIAAAIFRQTWWRRGFRSHLLCAGLALLGYELAVYGTGIFLGLTYWSRVGVFLMTALLSFAVMAALYPLIRRIHLIGGEVWKE